MYKPVTDFNPEEPEINKAIWCHLNDYEWISSRQRRPKGVADRRRQLSEDTVQKHRQKRAFHGAYLSMIRVLADERRAMLESQDADEDV